MQSFLEMVKKATVNDHNVFANVYYHNVLTTALKWRKNKGLLSLFDGELFGCLASSSVDAIDAISTEVSCFCEDSPVDKKNDDVFQWQT